MLAHIKEGGKTREVGEERGQVVDMMGRTLVDTTAQERKLLDLLAGHVLAVCRDRFGNLGFQSVNQLGVVNEVEASIPARKPFYPSLRGASDLQHPAHQTGRFIPPRNQNMQELVPNHLATPHIPP